MIDIPKVTQEVYLHLLANGDTRRRAARITGIDESTWRYREKSDPEFSAQVEKARVLGAGLLAIALRDSMMRQIAKGHPWWAKLAIWNYNVGLKDPDREDHRRREVDKHAIAEAIKQAQAGIPSTPAREPDAGADRAASAA